MSTPSPRFSLSAIAAALLAAGALVAPQLSLAQTLGGASGPAGDATKVEKCDAPKGTLAVVEPQDAVLQALLRIGLQSPTGMIRLIVQQSNCFQIVERGFPEPDAGARAGCRRPDAGRPERGQGPDGGS